MEDFELEIKSAFLDEAKELLESVEQCFLSLENASNDPSIIEQIFRLAHNFKGSAGAVGFVELKDFAHKFESLLLKIKQKEIPVSAGIVNLLLNCNDYLKSTTQALRVDMSVTPKDEELFSKLEACLKGEVVDDQSRSNEESKIEEINSEITHIRTPKTVASTDENIRVALSKIDQLLNSVGELSILQTVMDQQKSMAPSLLMQKTIGQMSKIIKEVQTVSMGLRMLPLKQTFQKMQRIVRDTSRELSKDVEFLMSGEETELDKTVIEQLGDPLVHLIRNAVDHGLETSDERLNIHKPKVGKIHLSAYHRGGQIVIEIRDDGRGLDAEKLKKKAIEKGLITPDSVLTEREALQLIFMPGFSTKENVTDVSGRGVGMDVVKTNIQQLQGSIEIETQVGSGTCFKIALPLTLAIIDGMVVTVGSERYVVPVAQIHETLRPRKEDIDSVQGEGEVLCLRGETLPLLRLDRLLRRPSSGLRPENGIALVCIVGQRSFAVLVTDVLCQQQVVIKRLGEELVGLPGLSGAAILGDGRASLILDLFEMTAPLRNKKRANTSDLQKGVA